MQTTLEVLISPADLATLSQRDLRQTVCIVFDILRATTTMMTALANGAAAILPVSEIAEALALRQKQPDALLAGERNGLRIAADLTGGVIRSEEHTSELQSPCNLVCRLLLEKKKNTNNASHILT